MKARKNDSIFPRLFYCGVFIAVILIGCQSTSKELTRTRPASDGSTVTPETVLIPAGEFISGSNQTERELGYHLDELAYGHSRTREQQWYARERPRKRRHTDAFSITKTPITNKQYALFVKATNYKSPNVSTKTWSRYGLVHPYQQTRRFTWNQDVPPQNREQHPVVLVSHTDATAYANWLSEQTGENWRLPDELEWEKAARGLTGNIFPWGNEFDPNRLNSHDLGPFDTLPVGQFPSGQSPFGLLDAAGQVFEWTADSKVSKRAVVKGGSWDDKGCGVCRAAARHTRPMNIKHILIGFRLVKDQ